MAEPTDRVLPQQIARASNRTADVLAELLDWLDARAPNTRELRGFGYLIDGVQRIARDRDRAITKRQTARALLAEARDELEQLKADLEQAAGYKSTLEELLAEARKVIGRGRDLDGAFRWLRAKCELALDEPLSDEAVPAPNPSGGPDHQL